jgi:hypothetical protein
MYRKLRKRKYIHQQKNKAGKHTSLTMNLNMFVNFPTVVIPSGFSNATKVCPGVS